jgi:hypothetical protein
MQLINRFLILTGFISIASCSQPEASKNVQEEVTTEKSYDVKRRPPHKYGGWYCPDNIKGFTCVNLADWHTVPVIHGRLPTEEEARSGQSLIFVDTAKYPEAKVLDMKFPRLAKYYNRSARKTDLVILIQGFSIDKDTVVGFRYLNGGNGSARLNEVELLRQDEIDRLPASEFISLNINIEASQDSIWKIMTREQYASDLNKFTHGKTGWTKVPNLNYWDKINGAITASYADKLYGCFYAQNDYESHTDKFLLLPAENESSTELCIVCGPFTSDVKQRAELLTKWSERIKSLAEKQTN